MRGESVARWRFSFPFSMSFLSSFGGAFRRLVRPRQGTARSRSAVLLSGRDPLRGETQKAEAPRGSGRELRSCPARTRRRKVQPKGSKKTAENADANRKTSQVTGGPRIPALRT